MMKKGDAPSGDEGVPRLFGLTLVKDEADIIRFCLQHASRFCDKIFVLDNGSDDGTWEIVQQAARNLEVVELIGRTTAGPFRDGLKGLVFQHARDELRPGDWVFVLDADEFLEGDPRPFLRRCTRRGWDAVKCYIGQFYPTYADLNARWFLDDGPVESRSDLPDHYRIDWETLRFFRYSDSLQWRVRDEDGSISGQSHPSGLDSVAPERLVIRHYQYRSKPQMKRRLALRASIHDEIGWFPHNADPDWSNYLQDASSLTRLAPGGELRVRWWERARVRYRRWKRDFVSRARKAIWRRLSRWWSTGDSGEVG